MKIFPRKIGAMPRRREGSPRSRGTLRRGHARLGEPEDIVDRLSGSPRRGVACLSEPLHLGRGKLRLSVPVGFRGLCLWPISGRSRGSVCDCYGLLRGPLCDLFERVIA